MTTGALTGALTTGVSRTALTTTGVTTGARTTGVTTGGVIGGKSARHALISAEVRAVCVCVESTGVPRTHCSVSVSHTYGVVVTVRVWSTVVASHGQVPLIQSPGTTLAAG